jgi:hypothetical protein
VRGLRAGVGLGLVLLLAGPAAASAQDTGFDWSTEAAVFGVNALLGGASAGVAALVRREPPLPAFARGVAGGGLIYAGKRIAVDPRPGTGLIGRQVASVGGSMVGNAVAGRGSLDRVALAFGPVRAYLGREVPGVEWRFDVPAVGAAVWGVATGGEIDIRESQSSGALVVRGNRELALPGTVFYSPADRERAAYVLAHEQVHILQYDQGFTMDMITNSIRWGALLLALFVIGAASARGISSLRGYDPTGVRSEYPTPFRPNPGPQLEMVFIGESQCPWSSHPDLAQAISATTRRLALLADSLGMSFRTIGVALDWSPRVGFEYLTGIGWFDEMSLGYNWGNSMALRYF